MINNLEMKWKQNLTETKNKIINLLHTKSRIQKINLMIKMKSNLKFKKKMKFRVNLDLHKKKVLMSNIQKCQVAKSSNINKAKVISRMNKIMIQKE